MNPDEGRKKFRDERTIQLINKCIGLKDSHIKRNNDILKKVLKDVLDAMKEHDEFFRDHFQNLVFVGSYYKGTKVGKPEEFDVNVIIKLPVKYESIQFEKGMPGFTKLKLNSADLNTAKWEKHRKLLSKWVTKDGYLDQDIFRQSMESLFMRVTPKLPEIENCAVTDWGLLSQIKVRKSGPAFTLRVTQRDTLEMCVDLVPVLEFNEKPPLPRNFSDVHWYAVPKPLKNVDEANLNWRMSFYNYEKKMLIKYGRLKPVIRQLKKLRDTEDWKIIPSYHIETLFMHYARDTEKNPELGKLTGVELFIHMLTRLKEACERQSMTNFWDDHHNLINAEKNQLSSIIGRLTRIIKQITADPVTMANCVLTQEELENCGEELNAIRNSRDSGQCANQQPTEVNNGPPFFPFLDYMNGPLKDTTPEPDANKSPPPTGSNVGSAELMDMLRLIRKDIADLKGSVDALSRRVAVIEQRGGASSLRADVAANPPRLATAASVFDYFFNGVRRAN